MTMNESKKPILAFPSVGDLVSHMAGEPASSAGFWLKLSKSGASRATIGKEEAIEAAICCGWIDGQLAKLDEHYFLVRMTPRRQGSRWSAKNRATADRLAGDRRLLPAGLAAIEAAKQDGRWAAAYASQASAETPADLEAALACNQKAREFYHTLDRANRFSIIYRVNDAKRAATRAKRIELYVGMLARGEVLHPPRRPD
jgi:uncharacterized protein YdeI (YjbR/CyaY-like superfamily)